MANLLKIGAKKTVLTAVQHHAKASEDAFSLINETLAKVANANQEIEIDIEASQQAIEAATAEKASLVAIRDKNAKMHSKIAKFFGTV